MIKKVRRNVRRITNFHSVRKSNRLAIAYVSGWIGRYNLVDEAIYAAITDIFNCYHILHFDGSKAQRMYLKYNNFIEYGIFAGATLINRELGYLQEANQFLKYSNHLFIFGTGVAHPRYWKNRGNWKDEIDRWAELLHKCEFVGVRGPMSSDYPNSVVIKGVEVVGDPVVHFADCNDYDSKEEYFDKSLGINTEKVNEGHVWGDERHISEAIDKIVNHATKDRYDIHWFVV